MFKTNILLHFSFFVNENTPNPNNSKFNKFYISKKNYFFIKKRNKNQIETEDFLLGARFPSVVFSMALSSTIYFFISCPRASLNPI